MTAPGDGSAGGFGALGGAPDAYLATARALWEAAMRAGAQPDLARRAASFAEELRALHPQFTGAWTAANAMPGLGAFAGGGAAPPFGAFPFPGFAASGSGAPPAPALGLTREHQLAWQRLQQLSAQAAQQQAQLAAVWGEIVGAALRELGTRVGARLAKAEAPATARELYDQWIDCAEKAFASAAHGPAYVKAQAALANTGAALRREQRELVESWARRLDLPTRAELDTVHKRIKAMQAELRELRAAAAAAKPPRRPRKPAARP